MFVEERIRRREPHSHAIGVPPLGKGYCFPSHYSYGILGAGERKILTTLMNSLP